MRLMLAQQLFMFVTAPPVVTPAMPSHLWLARIMNPAHAAAPPPSAENGPHEQDHPRARRQTIIVSVMESLRCYLPTFTLATVIHEIELLARHGPKLFRHVVGANRAQPTRRLTPRPRPTLAERMTSRPLRARSATPVAAIRAL